MTQALMIYILGMALCIIIGVALLTPMGYQKQDNACRKWGARVLLSTPIWPVWIGIAIYSLWITAFPKE